MGLKKDSIRSAGEISAEFVNAIDHIMNLYNTILSGKKEALDSKDLEIARNRKDYEKELDSYKLRLKEAENLAVEADKKAAEAIENAKKWETEAMRLTAENERLNNNTGICAEDISTLIAFAREMHIQSKQTNK